MANDVRQARAEAQAARARLTATIAELKARVSPKALALDAAEGAKNRASALVSSGSDAMRQRPWLPWAIGGAVGMVAAIRFSRRHQPGDRADTGRQNRSSANTGDLL